MIFKTNFENQPTNQPTSVFILHWIRLSEIKTGHDPCWMQGERHIVLKSNSYFTLDLKYPYCFFLKHTRTLIKYGSKCRIIEINSFQ